MINYEIYGLSAKEGLFHSFTSAYQYHYQQRIFVKSKGNLYACTIVEVTGDATQEPHVVRLACHIKLHVSH